MQESDVSQADIRPIELVRLNDESENDDPRFPADDSMDQETSQSLIPHSRTRDPDSSIAESSQLPGIGVFGPSVNLWQVLSVLW